MILLYVSILTACFYCPKVAQNQLMQVSKNDFSPFKRFTSWFDKYLTICCWQGLYVHVQLVILQHFVGSIICQIDLGSLCNSLQCVKVRVEQSSAGVKWANEWRTDNLWVRYIMGLCWCVLPPGSSHMLPLAFSCPQCFIWHHMSCHWLIKKKWNHYNLKLC